MKTAATVLALIATLVIAAAPATAAPPTDDVVDCTERTIRYTLQGTPQPCNVTTSDDGNPVVNYVECEVDWAKRTVKGDPAGFCDFTQSQSGSPLVECVKRAVDAIEGGYVPLPCTVTTSGNSPVEYVQCQVQAAKDSLKGHGSIPCYLW